MIGEFKTEVCGVPCIIRVTDWEPYRPPILFGNPDNWCPEEGGYGDYVILTLKGEPASRLVDEMSLDDEEKLDMEVFEFMERPTCQ
jgi:hypothetical protein